MEAHRATTQVVGPSERTRGGDTRRRRTTGPVSECGIQPVVRLPGLGGLRRRKAVSLNGKGNPSKENTFPMNESALPSRSNAALAHGRAFLLNKEGFPLNGRAFSLNKRAFSLNGRGFSLSRRTVLAHGKAFLFNKRVSRSTGKLSRSARRGSRSTEKAPSRRVGPLLVQEPRSCCARLLPRKCHGVRGRDLLLAAAAPLPDGHPKTRSIRPPSGPPLFGPTGRRSQSGIQAEESKAHLPQRGMDERR